MLKNTAGKWLAPVQPIIGGDSDRFIQTLFLEQNPVQNSRGVTQLVGIGSQLIL
jgi:hypothetical protein